MQPCNRHACHSVERIELMRTAPNPIPVKAMPRKLLRALEAARDFSCGGDIADAIDRGQDQTGLAWAETNKPHVTYEGSKVRKTASHFPHRCERVVPMVGDY